jgi:hypothetical protein
MCPILWHFEKWICSTQFGGDEHHLKSVERTTWVVAKHCSVTSSSTVSYSHYKAMDSTVVRNFRMRALKFIILSSGQELTLHDINQVVSKSNLAADEIINLDQHILYQNCTALLREYMQESSSTWVSLRYLNEAKQRVPGFD